MSLSPTGDKKRILIVEDHPLFRAMLVRLIEQELGMTVCGQTDNTQEALTLIGQTLPDAAIVDLTLVGSSGLELIKDLNARHIQLPVLVLSMHEEKLYAQRVLRAGARGFISKGASPSEVLTAIRTVLDGRVYLSERVQGTVLEQSGESSGVDLLSDREIEVFQLLGHGVTPPEIAGQLHLKLSTVETYLARMKDKLGIKNSAELYQRAAQWMAAHGL